jgi:hypothetical protein
MQHLKEEIIQTESQIESIRQQLDIMTKDYSIPLWKPIEANKRLTELVAYLKGLEYLTDYSGIETTVTVSSAGWVACKECKSGAGFNSTFGDRVDHYLKHGYKLLYFGQDSRSDDETPSVSIIAVLGREKVLKTQIAAAR